MANRPKRQTGIAGHGPRNTARRPGPAALPDVSPPAEPTGSSNRTTGAARSVSRPHERTGMLHNNVIEAIGHTPLVRLRLPGADRVAAYAKLELQNIFAMKDRVARQIILSARQSGELRPGAPIIESSSGTMALGV